MIDITNKQPVPRLAQAQGKIHLKPDTIKTIKNKTVKKGDALETAKIAGIQAVKTTQLLIPYCHQIPIDHVGFEFQFNADNITVTCTAKTIAKTGLEMEALMGVTMALNTLWDMVKYLEKDENGQYPTTKITDIKITKKVKG